MLPRKPSRYSRNYVRQEKVLTNLYCGTKESLDNIRIDVSNIVFDDVVIVTGPGVVNHAYGSLRPGKKYLAYKKH